MQAIPEDYWFYALNVGLWMIAIGYYFLSFAYIFTNRYIFKQKEDRQTYWLSFSLFFIFLGCGRAFYVIGDFFAIAMTSEKWIQIGTGFNWFAIGCLAIMSATMLLDNEKISDKVGYLMVVPPFVIGIIYPILYPTWVAFGTPLYWIFNLGTLIGYVILICWLFGYLAILIPGEIRKKSIWNMIGFILWFTGRTINTKFFQTQIPWGLAILSLISAAFVLLSLLAFSYSTRE
ncbi:MAG: hypothetical protein EAX96_12310 [Candidatus Lokiarchaeota archaeon]|nr:hypothetical protein [Candidatus Lokiarchaeota archaeon]